ncbi:hypothetical protein BDV19DRAFT_314899 [Aspergillus venezuelensis]
MGPEWYAEFASRYELEKKKLKKGVSFVKTGAGVMGPFWEAYALPTALNGRVGSIYGLNLATVNHACIPNSVLRFRCGFAQDQNGCVDWNKKPRIGRAVLIACADIPVGAEINISYTETCGSTKMRQKQMKHSFGFRCKCQVCARPSPEIDGVLCHYQKLGKALTNPDYITNNPSVTFQIAGDLLEKLCMLRVYDMRQLAICVQCALVAGHHSDDGRAYQFLKTAGDLALVLEGMTSRLYRHIKRWLGDLALMPGYGGTTRGLSYIPEGLILKDYIHPKKILFMKGVAALDYIRLNRYRPVTKVDKPKDGGDKKTKPGKGQRWEIVEGLDPAPPLLSVKAKTPHEMCRAHRGCDAGERVDGMARRRQAEQKSRQQSKRSARQKRNPDCVDPEKDFLAAYQGLVREMFGPNWREHDGSEVKTETASEAEFDMEGMFQFHICDEHLKQQREGKLQSPRKNKPPPQKKQTQAPVLKDVGAMKEVKVVNKMLEGIIAVAQELSR